MKRLRHILLISLALLAAACSPGDEVRPAQPSLSLDGAARRFEWTATGDDGDAYWALVSDLRYSDHDVAFDLNSLGVFSGIPVSRQLLGEPPPRAAGALEFFVAPRIDATGYYHHFLQIRDEVSNPSLLGSLGGTQPSDLVTFNPIQHQLRDDLGTPGGISLDGDINGDGLTDLVVTDPTDMAEKLYVYLGRDAYPFQAVDVVGTDADPVTGKIGVCPPMEDERRRLCAPDLVIDASALGGRFGGRSSVAEGEDRPVSSLAVSDIDNDERDEILVGAPTFEPFGSGEERGAVFVLDFDEEFVGTRRSTMPELDASSYLHIYNPRLGEGVLGRVTQADERGVLIDDVLPLDRFPADMSAGVPFDAPSTDWVTWDLFEEEPIQAFRRGSTISCPAMGSVPCTGDNVTVGSDFKIETGGISFYDVFDFNERMLLVLLDPLTGEPVYSALVWSMEYSAPGVLSRIEVLRATSLPDLATLSASNGYSFALYQRVAAGVRLPTPIRNGIESGAPGNPLALGNLQGKYDPATAGSVIRLLDPTAPRIVPDLDNGERYPDITFLGPEGGSNFGDVVDAKSDLNQDEIADIAIGAPTLSQPPGRYALTGPLAERGGVFLHYGDEDIKLLDVAGQGNAPDGIYDFGPEGIDRPASLILGRNAGERAGWAVAGARFRQDDPESIIRNEVYITPVTLAVGAPWACPRYSESMGSAMSTVLFDDCDGHRVGAVYLFVPHPNFESRDYRLPGDTSDGVWDLAGDPGEELYRGGDPEDEFAVVDAAFANAIVANQVFTPNERADVEIWGESDGDQLGWSLLLDSDLNGDHAADLVVGVPGAQGGEGKILIFHGSASEFSPSALLSLLRSFPQRTGTFGTVAYHGFRSRGNVDFDQRIDDDIIGFPDSGEDRCVMCVYDLSRPFPLWAVGPDLVLSGGPSAAIGRAFDGGFYNNDGYEELLLQAGTGLNNWIVVLNGLTNLLVQYRNTDLFAPLDSPSSANYQPESGTTIGSPPGVGDGPVGVPGSLYEGMSVTDTGGEPLGVSWWVERGVDAGYTRLGQAFIDVDAIYDETAVDQTSAILEEQMAFGRTDTDDLIVPGTRNTAELSIYYRSWPDNIQRWNVLTHGGFFAEGAGATTPFAATLNQLAIGEDHNGDGLADVGMIVEDMELRVAH